MQNNFFRTHFEKNKTILAPMAGVTTLPFRRLCKKNYAGMVVTEMISAKGLYYKNVKTKELMDTIEDEKPCGIQIFGSDEEVLSFVVKEYINESNFDFIDINMGCPMKKIVNNHDGSYLLKDPAKAGSVLNAVKKVSKKPVSVKIRIGWDSENINAKEVAKILEDNGADMIAIHGRTREQLYTGKADWDIIGEVAQYLKTSIVGNGDILTYQDGVDKLRKYDVDAVMIGRKAMDNPKIFKQINDCYFGRNVEEVDFKDKIILAKEHFEMICDYYGKDKRIIAEFRKYLYSYAKSIPSAARLRNMITESKTEQDIINIIDFLENYADNMR